MNRSGAWAAGLVIAGLVAGCSADGGSTDDFEVGQTADALSVCEEAVPADRFIDGFPAYAQCPTSENAAIFSNNGIDTATSAQGQGWVRTQYSGGYQCTELVKRYWVFKWNVTWQPRGNAGFWCDEQPPAGSGVVQTTAPVHGDVIVLPPGKCGAGAETGHVALVDTVDTARGRVTVVQQNRASRGSYELSCGKCFLHVTKNGGTPGAGGATGSGGATESGGASGGGSGGVGGSGGSGNPGSGGSAVPATGGVATSAGGQTAGGGYTASGGASPPGGAPPASGGGVPGASSGGAASGPSGPASGGAATAGTAGTSGSPDAGFEPDDEGGCAVSPRTAGAPGPSNVALALAAAALGLASRRRARRRSD